MQINNNVQLLKNRKEIVDKKTGEKKRYTNFKIRVSIGNRYIDIPIRPVDFGEKDNRQNYSMLNSVADLEQEKQQTTKDELDMPF